MPAKDDDLLARLNALKPTQVKLDASAPALDVGTSQPATVEDTLAERLKTLRSGGTPTKQGQSQETPLNKADALTAQIRDEVSSERDPIRNWQQQEDDEPDLDQLLAELGASDGQWKLDPEDPKHIQSLLQEAKQSLPREPADATQNHDTDRATEETSNEVDTDRHQTSKTEDQLDDEDADEYISKVLAELDVENKYGGAEDENTEPAEEEKKDTASEGLYLPSTPSQLKDLPDKSDAHPPSYEDSELEARFSKLGLNGLGLPSTPTAKPSSSKPKMTASLKPKTKPSLPVYTDKDIDSWCCICNEDGEVRCLGCDGDIYCQNCWNDGHGNEPGQERGHKAVQYNRKPPAAPA